MGTIVSSVPNYPKSIATLLPHCQLSHPSTEKSSGYCLCSDVCDWYSLWLPNKVVDTGEQVGIAP